MKQPKVPAKKKIDHLFEGRSRDPFDDIPFEHRKTIIGEKVEGITITTFVDPPRVVPSPPAKPARDPFDDVPAEQRAVEQTVGAAGIAVTTYIDAVSDL